jgi:hyperosmotically inducible periplasmic protein
MKSKSIYYMTLATVFVVTSALGACNRQQQSEGEAKYDAAKENAAEKYDEAKADVREGMNEAGAKMDDATITTKVKSSIIAEPGLDALDINVNTAGGVVTLLGTVDTSEHRTRAEEIARNTEGVKSVDNKLNIQAKS